ncbi:MAG: hypothetical protein MUF79_13535 [Burkholderiales bacterium]|jgi:hypothetical protein|nr:hypothetical protein [Burkholderiales bacterium]
MRCSFAHTAILGRAAAAAVAVFGGVAWHGAALAATWAAEVQINLCSDVKEIVRALQLRPAGAPREVWYFETPTRELFERGIVVRLRLRDRGGDLTLKVADQDCRRVDPALLRQAGGKCEFDLHGADFRGAVSLGRDLDWTTTKALLEARLPLSEALSTVQIGYLRDRTTAWPLPAGIAPRGPVRVDAYRPEGKRYVVEVWRLPGGQRYAELSQKSTDADAPRLRAALESELARAGVARCSDQSSQAGHKARDLVARP